MSLLPPAHPPLLPGQRGRLRIAGQYLFSATGMALGGVAGRVIFDLAGSYGPAFAAGLAFNAINFFLIGILFFRRRPSRLEPAVA